MESASTDVMSDSEWRKEMGNVIFPTDAVLYCSCFIIPFCIPRSKDQHRKGPATRLSLDKSRALPW